jgi:hypothetical protein
VSGVSGATVSETEPVASAGVGVAESETLTVKLKVPEPVGYPLNRPEGLSVRPLGTSPEETDHVYWGTPPVADSSVWYRLPCVPPFRILVVMARGGAAANVSVNEADSTDGVGVVESVTVAVNA